MASSREAVRLRPDDAVAWHRLAIGLDANGKPADATVAMRQSLRLDPANPMLWYWSGRRRLVDGGARGLEEAAAASRRGLLQAAEAPEAKVEAPRGSDGTDATADYYARVLELLPASDLANVWSSRSRLCNELAEFPETFDRLLARRPDDPLLWFARGLARARKGRWGEAVADFDRGEPVFTEYSSEFRFYHAGLRLLAGDEEGYRRLVGRLVEADSRAKSPISRLVLARIAGLGSHAIDDPGKLVRWAEEAVADNRTPWGLHVLGLAYYRAGRFREAVRRLEESDADWRSRQEDSPDTLVNWFALAMAHHELGDAERARYWLGRATRMLEGAAPEAPSWARGEISMTDWMEARVLHREAEEALRELLPALTPLSAIRRGESAPADATEAVMLAKLFAAKRLNAASARL